MRELRERPGLGRPGRVLAGQRDHDDPLVRSVTPESQLDRLLGVLGLGHITLGIIPPGRELTVAPMVGFLMADEVTVVESFTSMDTLRGEESEKYAAVADSLLADAVTGDSARALIAAAMTSLPEK